MHNRFGWVFPSPSMGTEADKYHEDLETSYPTQLCGFAKCFAGRSGQEGQEPPSMDASDLRTLAMDVFLRMGIPWDVSWSAIDKEFLEHLTTSYGVKGHRTYLAAGNSSGNKDVRQIDDHLARLTKDPLRAGAVEDTLFIQSHVAKTLMTDLQRKVKNKFREYAKAKMMESRGRHLAGLVELGKLFAVAIGCVRVASLLHFSVGGILQINPSTDTFYGPGLNALFHLRTYAEVEQVVPEDQVRARHHNIQ